jgi:NTE family protein
MKQILLVFAFVMVLQAGRGQVNLVMEGAGVKGFAYSGALQVLDSMGILQNIKRVAGTSVGAIQACLLAIGYTSDELIGLTANIPLRRFNDGGWFFAGGFIRLRNQFGWYKGERIAKWIEELIEAKTGNGDITFGELHAQREAKGYKDLYITGTDLTYQCLRVFSYEQYPQMRIRDAVRISLSIPLYYRAVLMDDTGRVYDKPNGQLLHVMVDGGVLSNYPIFIFDSTRYMPHEDNTTNRYQQNHETIGLLMEMPEQIQYNAAINGNVPLPIDNMRAYLRALYHTLIDKANPDAANGGTLRRTITIDNMNMSGRVRRLPAKTIGALQENGRAAARRYFSDCKHP